MIVRVFASITLSFVELRLELRDEDLDDKDLQMEEPWQHLSQTYEVIRDDDLNIEWIDNKKNQIDVRGGRNESEDISNDAKPIRESFRSRSVLS